MSVQSEITRLQNAKTALKTAIEGKGVTVPSSTKLDGYSALVDSIETGGGGNVSTVIVTNGEPLPVISGNYTINGNTITLSNNCSAAEFYYTLESGTTIDEALVVTVNGCTIHVHITAEDSFL